MGSSHSYLQNLEVVATTPIAAYVPQTGMQIPVPIYMEESTVIPSLMNLSRDDVFNTHNINVDDINSAGNVDISLMNLLQNAEIMNLKDWCYKNDSARAL